MAAADAPKYVITDGAEAAGSEVISLEWRAGRTSGRFAGGRRNDTGYPLFTCRFADGQQMNNNTMRLSLVSPRRGPRRTTCRFRP